MMVTVQMMMFQTLTDLHATIRVEVVGCQHLVARGILALTNKGFAIVSTTLLHLVILQK